jgi:hypothetical protein
LWKGAQVGHAGNLDHRHRHRIDPSFSEVRAISTMCTGAS